MNNKTKANRPKSHKKWYLRILATRKAKFLASFFSMIFSVVIIITFILYGPIEFFREIIVTSAMTTINHKYFATWFYSRETIDEILERNKVIDLNTVTDLSGIERTAQGTIKLNEIKGTGFKGWILEIPDPSWVKLGVSKTFGKKGQKMPFLLANYPNAIAGINAGGFGDANGFGNGGIPMGLVISEGETLYMPRGQTSFNIIGFNEDDILVLGNYKKSELESLKLRDAVEFKPFLIINGQAAEMKGNGGWGYAPRTAIGQKKDGTVLFLVIDGRQISSAGATIKAVQEIMIEYGAYNAANLDGGSSTVLSYNGEIINNPSGSDADGMRFLPNAFIVQKP